MGEAEVRYLITIVLAVMASFFITLVIHEVGHLIGGLAMGYRFMFIGFFGMYLEKKADRHVIRYHSGTGRGQCMMKPEHIETNAKWMILGGIAAQAIIGAVGTVAAVVLYIVATCGISTGEGYGMGIIWTLVIGLMNIAGALLNYFNNDAYADGPTYKEVRKGPEANMIYNQILEIGYLNYMGMSFLEMPDELFSDHGAEESVLRDELRLYSYFRSEEESADTEKLRPMLKEITNRTLLDDVKAEENILSLYCDKEIKNGEVLDCLDARTGLALALLGQNEQRPQDYFKEEAEKALYPGEWLTALRTFEKMRSRSNES